jgi:hypothetical protein
MKIALLVLLGLIVGALGGAALGIGAGLAWVQIFRTTGFEDYNGVLVFFTFMPLGAAIGGLGGAFLFGVIAIRDAEIALQEGRRAGVAGNLRRPIRICAMQKCRLRSGPMPLFETSNSQCGIQATASPMTPVGPFADR